MSIKLKILILLCNDNFVADPFVIGLFVTGELVFSTTVVLLFFVYLCLSKCDQSSNSPLPSSVEIGIGVNIVALLHKLLAQKQYFTLFAILQSIMGYSLQDFNTFLP